MMLARMRAVVVVLLIVAAVGGLPGVAPSANAEPRNVTVAVYDLTPFVMTRAHTRAGFTVDLLDQIAKRNGWSLTYVDGGGSVRGLLDAVSKGRVDLAATNISITADREKYLDFSQPILTAGLQIVVPAGTTERTQPGLVDFLRLLFSKTMLFWLLAAVILTIVPAHLIWLLERRDSQAVVSKKYFPGIFQSFEWGLGMLSNAPVNEPHRWLTRTLSVLWMFVAIAFVAYFTAILTSNLTVEKINSKVSAPADLIGKRVCAVANTTSSTALNKLGVEFTAVPNIEDCYPGLRKGSFDAIVDDAPVLEYWVTHDGAGFAELAGPVFKEEDYGAAFPLGSKLRKEFDQALLSMQEDGDYGLLKQKWFSNR
ncbi:MAG: transporter substrate-binding domain-containing protein [Mycolicibacterium sp.]|nr:transporter substrate-binding domain-containing protein [Mycobacterium sp.]MCB9415714.1 transporter substrate-binding domain-containing protein [Mycolicibacterium sp.]